MRYEIDVSGHDIFKKGYVICIANKDNDILKGFKFDKDLINKLVKNWEKGKYRYDCPSKRGFFKVRLYCIVIYYLFKSINKRQDKISLTICKDFAGRENEINNSLKYFLEKKLHGNMGKPLHQKLPKKSKAHCYAYLMYKDTLNKLPTYVNISLKEFEKFLLKKVTPKGHLTES